MKNVKKILAILVLIFGLAFFNTFSLINEISYTYNPIALKDCTTHISENEAMKNAQFFLAETYEKLSTNRLKIKGEIPKLSHLNNISNRIAYFNYFQVKVVEEILLDKQKKYCGTDECDKKIYKELICEKYISTDAALSSIAALNAKLLRSNEVREVKMKNLFETNIELTKSLKNIPLYTNIDYVMKNITKPFPLELRVLNFINYHSLRNTYLNSKRNLVKLSQNKEKLAKMNLEKYSEEYIQSVLKSDDKFWDSNNSLLNLKLEIAKYYIRFFL